MEDEPDDEAVLTGGARLERRGNGVDLHLADGRVVKLGIVERPDEVTARLEAWGFKAPPELSGWYWSLPDHSGDGETS